MTKKINFNLEEDACEVWKCPSCDHVLEDACDQVKIYECPECGENFTKSTSYTGDGHQCPNDHKFSSTSSENGCPECDDGTEMENVDMFKCRFCDDEYFDTEEEYRNHLLQDHEGELEDEEAEDESGN